MKAIFFLCILIKVNEISSSALSFSTIFGTRHDPVLPCQCYGGDLSESLKSGVNDVVIAQLSTHQTAETKKKKKKKGNELKCPFCPKYYFNANRLQNHIDLHPEADDLPEDWTPEGWTPTQEAAATKTPEKIENADLTSPDDGSSSTRAPKTSDKIEKDNKDLSENDNDDDTATPLTKLEIKSEEPSTSSIGFGKRHPCNFCTETFVKVSELSNHIFQAHTKELEVVVQNKDKKIDILAFLYCGVL